MSRLSVVCRLSVTLLHPMHKLELFGNIFAQHNSSGTQAVCTNVFGGGFEMVLGEHAS